MGETHREHTGPLFAAAVTTLVFIAVLLGDEPQSRWMAGFVIIGLKATTLVAFAVAASWAGTIETPMAKIGSGLVVGTALLSIILSNTIIVWRGEMKPDDVRFVFQLLNLVFFAGLTTSFVSMALETKVLASDPARFAALVGAGGAVFMGLAPFLELSGSVYNYIFLGATIVALVVFGMKAKAAAASLPTPGPQMKGWHEALEGADRFKTALTWLILAGFIINFVSNKMTDRDMRMWTAVGALVVNAGILIMAARGAASFRAIPQLTQAKGAAHAAAAFTLMAAAISTLTVLLAGAAITDVIRGLSMEYLIPRLEAVQSLMWISAVLSFMAALATLGRTMNAPALRKAALMGIVFFGLGALATLTAKGALLRGLNSRGGELATMVIVGLVGVVVLITGLVYVFKALGEANEHLLGAKGEQVAAAMD